MWKGIFPSQMRRNVMRTKCYPARTIRGIGLLVALAAALPSRAPGAPMPTQDAKTAHAHGGNQQPPPPCHPNPHAARDQEAVRNRQDVRQLPGPLRDRLGERGGRRHSVGRVEAFAEANSPSQLFWYFLLDSTGFEPNPFTHLFPGLNDQVMLTATGGNCGLPTVGAVRVVLEPKPDLPTDPNDPRAFIDVFTDISGLFVINNESGWY